MTVRRILGLLVLGVFGLGNALARADSLESAVQQRILGATFEVVQLKPADGAVTYERPLPMDLIPYQQRVDKYRSIGTAFAIGPNRFVTAGHVLSVGLASQFGPPALRDAGGTVYDIDRVLKYSDEQDFVEFSLKNAPSAERVLTIAAPPPLNETVFAVGNALGQGVVIRDGVFTSETPEESSGRWKWLRFTAAASPGNSGGPLVDKSGNVVGIVLRKSEAENLNYAAPISLVAAAPDTEARFDGRVNFRLAVMANASEVVENHERVPLPASLADFYTGMKRVLQSNIVKNDALLLEHNKDKLFPNSPTSARLLEEVARSPFPRMIREQQDGNWALVGPQVKDAQLENNGYVRYGGVLYLLRAPDDVKLATLFSDSKVYMDLMLRSGLSLNRNIGSASIKVTSLGKAVEESTNTDAWGRTWQVKIWAIPYDDLYLVTMSLPTPQGYAAIIMPARSSLKDALVQQQRILANFTYVTLEGTLARWREYLPLKTYQPRIFGNLNLSIDSDYKKVRFTSKRVELEVTPDVMSLLANSILTLNFSYFRDGGAVVWDVGGLAVGEGPTKNDFVDFRRYSQPDASLPDGFQSSWKKLVGAEFPFNAVAVEDTGGMKVSSVVGPPGAGSGPGSSIRYGLTVRKEGAPGQDIMRADIDALQKSFKDLEH